MEINMPQEHGSTPPPNSSSAAVEAVKRGYQPIPLVTGEKVSKLSGWSRLKWENTSEGLEQVRAKFDEWAKKDWGGLGILMGAPSGDLIDVDLDHDLTRRLKDHFLPPTAMRSGRGKRPGTHYWYRAKPGTLLETRTFKLPKELEDKDKTMIVEYRSTGSQTAFPPTFLRDSAKYPGGDEYLWYDEPWGGDQGPTEVDGRVLAVQVALLGLCTLLVKYWPGEGGRHEAYLALAGGLLRVGDGVHPYWERNAEVIIGAIADATLDDEGPEGRIEEVLDSTLTRLRSGKPVQGFGKLGEIIGEAAVRQARVILDEIESLAGVPSRSSATLSVEGIAKTIAEREAERIDRLEEAERRVTEGTTYVPEEEEASDGVPRDPLEERIGTWEALDLDPYLTGQVAKILPSIMERVDGQCLFYPGRLNMLYGPSESAKSWIAMHTCVQEIEKGGRVVYLDFEDEPVNAIERLQLLGAGYDDLRNSFSYVRPEDPLEPMQRSRWGDDRATDEGKLNNQIFLRLLEERDPTLIVADGMSVLYGLHGLDTNDTTQTEIITSWLKTLSRNGRSTVIVVDHTAKDPQRGSMPIGSQHKVSMVQGTMLQAYPVRQPMPGAIGEVELIVLKDRPGQVRKIAQKSGEKAQLAARVLIDSQASDTVTTIALHPPAEMPKGGGKNAKGNVEVDLEGVKAAERSENIRQEDAAVLRLFGGDLSRKLKFGAIAQAIYGKDFSEEQRKRMRTVLGRLVTQSDLHKEGNTRSTEYSLLYAVEESEGIDIRP